MERITKLILVFLFGFLLFPLIVAENFPDTSTTSATATTVTVTTLTGNFTNISQASDTDITYPVTDTYVLTWNSSSSKWEPVSAAAVGDTNETTRFDTLVGTDCDNNEKMLGVDTNGNVVCEIDLDNNTLYYANGIYIYKNSSNFFFLNETKLNQTINLLNATGYIKDWNATGWIINWSQVISSSSGITWAEATNGTLMSQETYNTNYSDFYPNLLTALGYNDSGYIKDWNATGWIINWSQVISPSSGISWEEATNGSLVQYNNVSNLNVNSSNYWDNFDSENTTQFNQGTELLGINTTWLTNFIQSISTFVLGEEDVNTTHIEDGTILDVDLNLTNITLDDFTNDAGFLTSETNWNANYSDFLVIASWNDTGLIRDWNSTGYIINWNSSGFIKNWTVEIVASNESLYNWIVAQSYTAGGIDWADATNGTLYLSSNPSGFWNDTYATFNKTYADTLYYALNNPYGFYNSTDFSITDYLNTTYVLGNITEANTSVVNWIQAQGYLTSYTETDPHWSANYTLYNTTWSTDTNTYNTTEEMQDAVGGALDGNFTYDDSGDSITINGTAQSNFLRNFFDSIYRLASSLIGAEDIEPSAINTTHIEDGNVNDEDLNLTDITILDFSNDAGYYNSTDFSISDYSTTAEIIAFGYYNSTDFVITDYFTKSDILGFDYYNSTDFDIADYFTSSEVLAFNYYNSTDFDINDYVTSVTLEGYGYYNSTDFSISDYYTKTQIDNFNYWNDTSNGFNETYADTLYEPISTHFDASTNVNITCLNSACTWYFNATNNCEYGTNSGVECWT